MPYPLQTLQIGYRILGDHNPLTEKYFGNSNARINTERKKKKKWNLVLVNMLSLDSSVHFHTPSLKELAGDQNEK